MISSREFDSSGFTFYKCKMHVDQINNACTCVRYADKPNAYWTGYFTSRPAFKKYVRDLSGYYLVWPTIILYKFHRFVVYILLLSYMALSVFKQAARQLEFLRGRDSSGPTTDMLADALAIAQHHDAVSGTQRQHVAADYALRLSMGYLQVIFS